MLKPIPEELKKQGVRWVSLRNKMGDIVLLIEEDEIEFFYIACHVEIDNYVNKSGGYTVYMNEHSFKEEIPQPQEPKKIPYTAETFPENALWIRSKKSKNIIMIQEREEDSVIWGMTEYDCSKLYFKQELNEVGLEDSKFTAKNIEDYEIGCQVIKDREIKIEWRPFYQIKE